MYEKIDIPQPLADEIVKKAEKEGISLDDVVVRAIINCLRKDDENAGK